ncbi:hypothetical protein [Burkholderia thailandensis]|uniref:hypothetical protein n=1 Tax=Burkholderia thailandensis TaxID=57975 RepID=UPI001EF04642|nr:hypothetical protein [Burkholderia thailandensis]
MSVPSPQKTWPVIGEHLIGLLTVSKSSRAQSSAQARAACRPTGRSWPVCRLRVRDRAPSSRPDGSAPVMSLGAGQAGAASHTANDASRSFAHGGRRAEIAPLARRPAGHSCGACSANAGNAISRDAPQRHRRLAAFRSDDFDRASRRTMAHGRRSIRVPMRRAALRRRSTPIDTDRHRSIRAIVACRIRRRREARMELIVRL